MTRPPPAVVRSLVDALPDAHWELLPGASHCAHLEQAKRFLAFLEAFLAAHDRSPVATLDSPPTGASDDDE